MSHIFFSKKGSTAALGIMAVFLSISFVFCENKAEKIENPALTPEKTAKVMFDLLVADGASTAALPALKDSLMGLYYRQVFELNGVSAADYEQSLAVFAQQKDALEKIYAQVDTLIEQSKR